MGALILGILASIFFIRSSASIPFIGCIFWMAIGACIEAYNPGTTAAIIEIVTDLFNAISNILGSIVDKGNDFNLNEGTKEIKDTISSFGAE